MLPCIDNKNAFEAILTDLSKAFDSANHKLLMAKRHVCNLDLKLSKPILIYLNIKSTGK